MAASLNTAQDEAVQTLSGPLLVLAGAGTGKTRVVTFRIARLIRSGIKPSRILGVTFTNKAAGEMQERAGALLGKRSVEKPEISTFHSLCVRILRRHIRKLGYPEQFAIYDRGDQEAVARAALRDIRVPHEQLRPGNLVQQIGRWKTGGIRPDTAASHAQSDREHLAAMAYRKYQTALRSAGAVDFDDLLLLTEDLLTESPEVRRAESNRFDHLLVDEYQDTNGSQYRIVKSLATPHRNLCVVGDDDQSIYAWRGAEVTHILNFQRDWPDAKIVRLEDNYRSRAPIIELANRLIAHNRLRHGKVLRAARQEGETPRVMTYPDENVEARSVVEEIAALIDAQDVPPRDFAILFRTNEQPRAFETELRRANVPYTIIGGQSFYDRAEVRDIMAYLKLLAYPRDEVALRRIINTPPRGIGAKAVEKLTAEAVARSTSLADVLETDRVSQLAGPTAIAGIHSLRETLDLLRADLKRMPLADVAKRLLQLIQYQHEIERNYKDPNERAMRWYSVEEVINSLAAYEKDAKRPSLGAFLNELALVGRDDENDKESKLERNAVVLMTLHSAKGLEFPRVYLVGLEEGILPHHRSLACDGPAIDEERRLCYVGVTRARDELTITTAEGRHKWGKLRPSIPSRFLYELLGKAEQPQAIENLRRSQSQFSANAQAARAIAKNAVVQSKPQAAKRPTAGRANPSSRARPRS